MNERNENRTPQIINKTLDFDMILVAIGSVEQSSR
jgi:hypothetical protein